MVIANINPSKSTQVQHNCAYNDVHNILRHFDRQANFLFTTSEKKRDFINKHGIYDELILRILGSQKISGKS